MKTDMSHSLMITLAFSAILVLVLFQCRSKELKETKAPESWFSSKTIENKVWRIDDHGIDNIYLVTGDEKALLIDTGMGIADLAEYVKSLTDLPLMVVNTHGHPDHAGGNYQFTGIYAHPADLPMMERFTSKEYHAETIQRMLKESPQLESCMIKETADFDTASVQPVTSGEIFDLGGRKLEVIETPGHTKGSICLLDAQNKLLFSGDNDNTLVWLFLQDCLPLEVYLQTLQKLQQRDKEFDTILPGHGDPIDKSFIADQIVCAQNILSGDCKGEPYHSFAGDALVCSYQRASIAFNPENLRVKN